MTTPAVNLEPHIDPSFVTRVQQERTQASDNLSEDGLAIMFLKDTPTIRYCSEETTWYYFDRRRWARDRTLRVPNLIREALRKKGWEVLNWAEVHGDDAAVRWAKRQTRRLGSVSIATAVEKLLRSDESVAVTPELFDANPWILNTPGGAVDLTLSKGTQSARMDDYCSRMTAVAPSEDKCPLWIGFLDLVTAGDQQFQRYLQRLAGYCLTGSVEEHALFFMYGPGGNGKSTFLDTLHDILGDGEYATALPLNALMSSKGDHIPVEVAKLRGHRLALTDEVEDGKAWNEGKIKTLTGGDILCGRALYQNLFDFHPTHKLIVAGNSKPSFQIVDDAIRRRLHLIPFEVKISHPDKKFRDRLKAEWAAILHWAIEGCFEWSQQGLNPPPRILAPSSEYLQERDCLGEWIRECCEEAGATTCRGLYSSWRAWSLERGEEPGSIKRFAQQLGARPSLTNARIGHAQDRGFIGICLKGVAGADT